MVLLKIAMEYVNQGHKVCIQKQQRCLWCSPWRNVFTMLGRLCAQILWLCASLKLFGGVCWSTSS